MSWCTRHEFKCDRPNLYDAFIAGGGWQTIHYRLFKLPKRY